MIDTTVEAINLFMLKKDTYFFPAFGLPSGFYFDFYRKGDEVFWAELEFELGQFSSTDRGIEVFRNEFLNNTELSPEERMIFVKDPDGKVVGTGTLWDGDFLGERLQRIHWIAVSDSCAGMCIGKAIVTRLLELHSELGYSSPIYLWTGTRYYPAVNMYRKFGFSLYEGERDPITANKNEEFARRNRIAISIVNEKINKYRG